MRKLFLLLTSLFIGTNFSLFISGCCDVSLKDDIFKKMNLEFIKEIEKWDFDQLKSKQEDYKKLLKQLVSYKIVEKKVIDNPENCWVSFHKDEYQFYLESRLKLSLIKIYLWQKNPQSLESPKTFLEEELRFAKNIISLNKKYDSKKKISLRLQTLYTYLVEVIQKILELPSSEVLEKGYFKW